jgi:glutathione S-transferase
MPAAARGAARAILPAFRAFYTFRHDINPATIESGRAKVAAALDRIEAELQPSGYLVGDAFSVADLTAAALFSPLLMPPEFPYPPAGPEPEALVLYRRTLDERRAARWVREMYRRHRGTSAEIAG